MHHTAAGGMVLVAARASSNTVVIEVLDNGQGIAPEDLPHVFDRFYRADKARGRNGAGLGLANVKLIVEAHGGSIWVESELGHGSRFLFTLPTSTPL